METELEETFTEKQIQDDRRRLAWNESIMCSSLNKVGEHLKDIRDTRCYQHDFLSFEQYCEKKLGMSDRRARRLIGMSEVRISITQEKATSKQILAFAEAMNEAQAEVLSRVPAENRKEVVEKAIRQAKAVNSRVTTKIIDAVVTDVQPDEQQSEPEDADSIVEPVQSPSPKSADLTHSEHASWPEGVDDFDGLPPALQHCCPNCGHKF